MEFVWAYEKSISGRAILHAYDATQISSELWNSNMNGGTRSMGTGIGFGTPVVVNGKVIVAVGHGCCDLWVIEVEMLEGECEFQSLLTSI